MLAASHELRAGWACLPSTNDATELGVQFKLHHYRRCRFGSKEELVAARVSRTGDDGRRLRFWRGTARQQAQDAPNRKVSGNNPEGDGGEDREQYGRRNQHGSQVRPTYFRCLWRLSRWLPE